MPSKYLVGDLVGVGGMGMVHRATREGTHESLAIKQLRSELAADPAMVARFAAELDICRHLDHPDIASIVDDGAAADGVPFFVMSWVEGEPLGALLARVGPPTLADALAIGRRLLDVIAYAHGCGIVHGDIKPDNVMVTGTGASLQVTLIDWGLARFAADNRAPSTDFVSGTPGYMAPEILRGGAPTVSSDIYAVGVVLFELLAGSTPFGEGTAAQIFQRQLHGDLDLPSWRAPERMIPAAFDVAVLRALARDPQVRFASVQELASAFTADVEPEAPVEIVLARASSCELSTTAPTRDWRPPTLTHQRLAVGTQPPETLTTDSSIVAGCLSHVSMLLSAHRLQEAALELEGATERVASSENLWPLLLSLSAVKAGLGNCDEARELATTAKSHSHRAKADIGERRADALLRRLG